MVSEYFIKILEGIYTWYNKHMQTSHPIEPSTPAD